MTTKQPEALLPTGKELIEMIYSHPNREAMAPDIRAVHTAFVLDVLKEHLATRTQQPSTVTSEELARVIASVTETHPYEEYCDSSDGVYPNMEGGKIRNQYDVAQAILTAFHVSRKE